MDKKRTVTNIKGQPIKEYKREHWQIYKEKNKRIALTVSNKTHAELLKKATELHKSIPEFILTKLDSDIHKGVPPELKDQLREISFLLRNATNNINQIAYQLNLEALESGHVDVNQSKQILSHIYSGIDNLENIITSYIQEKSHDTKINEPKNPDV